MKKKYEVIITRQTEFSPIEVKAKNKQEAEDLVILLQDDDYNIRKQKYMIESREV